MSSTTYNSASTSVDPRQSGELIDDLGLNSTPFNNPPFSNNYLSPCNQSQINSNSTSPSNNLNSTSGDSFSEYSTYQQSELSEIEIEDPFFGVDFSRIDSLPSNLLSSDTYQPPDFNRSLPDLPLQLESKPSTETFTASTYPLSPVNSSAPDISSPKGIANELKTNTTNSRRPLNDESHTSQFPAFDPLMPAHNSTVQLTPDQSGSSHTSAESFEPGTMAHLEHSPHVTVSQWGDHGQSRLGAFVQPVGHYSQMGDFGAELPNPNMMHAQAHILRDEDGSWMLNDRTRQAGLDPERRKVISNAEVPNLKDQEERRRIENKNIEVQEWRSQAGGSSDADDEKPAQSYFPVNNEKWYQQSKSGPERDAAEENNNIPLVDDAESVHENRLIEGQVYYHPEGKDGAPLNEADRQLMKQPRHWNDAPSFPFALTTTFQPPTSNDAIREFKRNADTISIASRAATWGTRRRSEPSLADFDAVADGSFLKKLSISKSKEHERPRQNSLFDQGLDRIANIVRNRSDSKLKRARSTQNIPEEVHAMPHSRQNSQGTLAPPPRTSSFGKRPTPSINTAFAYMAGPLAAVGATHTRSGSVSATATSPRSPNHLGFRSVIKRARSRSELTSQEKVGQIGLVDLWRGQGGPPLPTLASPPIEAEPKQAEAKDLDEDEDDDDEQGDDADMKIESDEQAIPIVPNYEGFKAHVRHLNGDMDPRYNWLVSRIAHQQEIRYKNLLDLRVKHSQAIGNQHCAAGRHCISLGGSATLLDTKGQPRDAEQTGPLQLVTEFSDNDSNPGEGALNGETFPQGVPMPPTRNLPAEFECQLCFKAKKFQKPSDWTKHVHEDVQPFTCTYDKCKEPKSFKRKADWVRHENERHRHLEWWICQVEDCRHPCYRKDNFLQHLVREHKLPEPKQKTKAAIKKARLTEPAWKLLEQCHHETQNRPQDEPCKFCGRSFATWKKLTVHLAKHMEHISLPVLKLVAARNVDANTIISPVEQILTPITPGGREKMESASPFNMDSISPHVPMPSPYPSTGFDQSTYYQTAGSSTNYTPMTQEAMYAQNNIYSNPNAFGVHQMDQPRAFGSLDSGNISHVNQNRGFAPANSGFSQPNKVELSRGYGSLDASFSHQIPDQSYNSNPASGFSMPQDYTSAPAAVSSYPTTNMLGINDSGYGYDPMAVNAAQNFQQVPMSRAPGSNSSYGQHSPQNMPYYGPQ
ncbi:hypothetical protein LSUB1_G004768 [Lachnellula subtilissima]|uniref:C2H2-type domain-containing protein n=1 Tax=Lachnellula subtilissima TaxID=602034 RepID=A0A8H8RKW7_9HELO|nr:hypothetical protein LSUB1_G004768 [Lachnellula subtilissima]